MTLVHCYIACYLNLKIRIFFYYHKLFPVIFLEHHPTSIDHHGNIPESVLLPPEVFSKHTKAPSDYAITTTLPDTADKPIIQSDGKYP